MLELKFLPPYSSVLNPGKSEKHFYHILLRATFSYVRATFSYVASHFFVHVTNAILLLVERVWALLKRLWGKKLGSITRSASKEEIDDALDEVCEST